MSSFDRFFSANCAAQADTKAGHRRPDPRAKVTEQLHAWFAAEPWRTGRELLARLQVEYPGTYRDGLLRILQHRLKLWRSEIAHTMVFGAMHPRHAETRGAEAWWRSVDTWTGPRHGEFKRGPTLYFETSFLIAGPVVLVRSQRNDQRRAAHRLDAADQIRDPGATVAK